jgi:hypothetical protein
MKVVAMLFVFFMLAPFFVGNSYGVTTFPHSDPSLPVISLQLELRNSDKQLILYIEPTTMYIDSVPGLHKYLDTQSDKTVTFKDGIKYETVHFKHADYFGENDNGQVTTSPLHYSGSTVLTVRYDGFIPHSGDVLYADWKIVRIAH